MVVGQRKHFAPIFRTEDSPTVAHISYVTHFVHNQDHQGTAAGSLDRILRVSEPNKLEFGLAEACLQGFDGLIGEVLVLGDLDKGGITYRCMLSLRKLEQ